MPPKIEFVTKTQHYLKVKKPMLERQRRARMNKCLDNLRQLIAEFQGNDAIMRMDKAEMLEAALQFVRVECKRHIPPLPTIPFTQMNSFRNGFMNAVNEISRVMAATPGISVDMGKTIMTHLGCEFNRLLNTEEVPQTNIQITRCSSAISIKFSLSPASSGYGSDNEDHQLVSSSQVAAKSMWRPW